MSSHPRILLVSSDADVTRQLVRELSRRGCALLVPAAANLRQARLRLRRAAAEIVVLDQSAIGKRGWAATVAGLVQQARVICLASIERQEEAAALEEFVAQHKAAVVWREGRYVARLLAALDAFAAPAAGVSPEPQPDADGGLPVAPEDFGEILRHEVNNPLTGILGNAELLLARRESLPPAAVRRVETIAELAVRLRETVRRLSNAWESSNSPDHRHARLA
jgi:signal transduction histidine kinase